MAAFWIHASGAVAFYRGLEWPDFTQVLWGGRLVCGRPPLIKRIVQTRPRAKSNASFTEM